MGIQVIAEVSGGVPRVINRICDRALHHGWVKGASQTTPTSFVWRR